MELFYARATLNSIMDTKHCPSCDETKSIEDFNLSKNRKGGREGHCRMCRKAYRQSTKEHIRKRDKAYKDANIDKINKQRLAYRQRNRERETERAVQWQKDNPDKVAVRTAKRKASKLNATPTWFETTLVEQVYAKCAELNELWGTDFQVDHFIPLQGDNVCGLHCWDNLQILDRSINASKNNTNPLK